MRYKKFLCFEKRELKNDFYPLFLKLRDRGLKIEAYLLMLSTWNIGRFKFVAYSFNLSKFVKTADQLEMDFKKIEKEDFRKIQLDRYKDVIKKIFRKLRTIRGVEKTGASKLMHLRLPKVFIMWDSYIRASYGFGNGDENDYFNFLSKMQETFRDFSPCHGRTLAKSIDEHNYNTISKPDLIKARSKK